MSIKNIQLFRREGGSYRGWGQSPQTLPKGIQVHSSPPGNPLVGTTWSLLLLARRARRPLSGAPAVPEHRSVGWGEGGEGAASDLLCRLQPAVSAGAFEPAVRAHGAAERLGGDLARRGHDGGGGGEEEEEEDGDGDSGGVEDDDDDDDATAGSVPRPPLRWGVIRLWGGGVRGAVCVCGGGEVFLYSYVCICVRVHGCLCLCANEVRNTQQPIHGRGEGEGGARALMARKHLCKGEGGR